MCPKVTITDVENLILKCLEDRSMIIGEDTFHNRRNLFVRKVRQDFTVPDNNSSSSGFSNMTLEEKTLINVEAVLSECIPLTSDLLLHNHINSTGIRIYDVNKSNYSNRSSQSARVLSASRDVNMKQIVAVVLDISTYIVNYKPKNANSVIVFIFHKVFM